MSIPAPPPRTRLNNSVPASSASVPEDSDSKAYSSVFARVISTNLFRPVLGSRGSSESSDPSFRVRVYDHVELFAGNCPARTLIIAESLRSREEEDGVSVIQQ